MPSVSDQSDMLYIYNRPLQTKKRILELQGVAAAIIYDGKLDDSEISLIEKWLIANDEFLTTFPLCELKEIYASIVKDGVVTQEERNLLFEFLSNIADSPEGNPVIEGVFTPNPIITFTDKQFLFTGELIYGTRTRAMNTVEKLGGINSLSKSFTLKDDYLVIGSLGSEFYKYGRFGSKIERAIELIKCGKSNAQIINERTFVQAVTGMI